MASSGLCVRTDHGRAWWQQSLGHQKVRHMRPTRGSHNNFWWLVSSMCFDVVLERGVQGWRHNCTQLRNWSCLEPGTDSGLKGKSTQHQEVYDRQAIRVLDCFGAHCIISYFLVEPTEIAQIIQNRLYNQCIWQFADDPSRASETKIILSTRQHIGVCWIE